MSLFSTDEMDAAVDRVLAETLSIEGQPDIRAIARRAKEDGHGDLAFCLATLIAAEANGDTDKLAILCGGFLASGGRIEIEETHPDDPGGLLAQGPTPGAGIVKNIADAWNAGGDI